MAGTDEGQRRPPSRAESLRLSRMPARPAPHSIDPAAPRFADFTKPQPSAPDPGPGRPRRRGLLIGSAVLALVLLAGGVTAYRLADAGPTAPAPAVPIVTDFQPEATAPSLADLPTEQVSQGPSAAAPPPVPSPSAPSPAASPGVSAKAVTGRANPSGTNLALNGTATASAIEGRPWSVDQAVDGDPATRWSSGFADPQWIRIDLKQRWQLTEIRLLWEHAYGVDYRVDTSLDGKAWRKLWSTTAGAGGTVSIDAKSTVARYVRMYGTRRNTTYGYSLLELEVR